MQSKITEKQKKALDAIYESIQSSGFPPTFADLREKLNVASNQAVLNFLESLEKKELVVKIDKNPKGFTYSKRLRWRISNKAHEIYSNHQ